MSFRAQKGIRGVDFGTQKLTNFDQISKVITDFEIDGGIMQQECCYIIVIDKQGIVAQFLVAEFS